MKFGVEFLCVRKVCVRKVAEQIVRLSNKLEARKANKQGTVNLCRIRGLLRGRTQQDGRWIYDETQPLHGKLSETYIKFLLLAG